MHKSVGLIISFIFILFQIKADLQLEMDVQDSNHHSFSLHNYQYKLNLQKQILQFQIQNSSNFEKYIASINHQTISNNKNLSFFFSSPVEIFDYFKTNCGSDIQLMKNGDLHFIIQTNLGKSIKAFQCIIQTVKVEIQPEERLNIKIDKLQKEVQSHKQQNNNLKLRILFHEQEVKSIKRQVQECLKIISVKDQIITNIFSELKTITQWKEQEQKKASITHKFQPDDTNPHDKKFNKFGNRIKKNSGGSWDILLCKNAIQKNNFYRYNVKQIRAGPNGSFMYGIGSESIKGMNRAQDSKQFIGYYQNTGSLFEQGQSRRAGPKIKDGQTVTIEVDTRKWLVSWLIEGKKQAESNIPKQLRERPLYLALIVFNQVSEMEFF